MCLRTTSRAGAGGNASWLRATAVSLALWWCACNSSDPTGPQAFIVVENYSTAWSVTGVFRRTPDESSWGINELNSDVDPGQRRTLDFPPDTYDIRAVAENHPRSPLELYAIDLQTDEAVFVEVTDAALTAVF